jgi:hypothetical protein
MAYHSLVEALKTQSPEVVVLEANVFFDIESDYHTNAIATTVPVMAPSLNKIDQIFASVPPDGRAAWLFDISENHDRIYQLDEDQATDYRNLLVYGESYKGSSLQKPYFEDPIPEPNVPTEESFAAFINPAPIEGKPLYPKHKQYLKKIIELCLKKGIALEVIDAPAMDGSLLTLFPELQEICKANGVGTTDYCTDAVRLGLDWEYDFNDKFHVSWTGAEKVTKAAYIDVLEKYDLPDHRGDPSYESWDTNAYLFEAFAEGLRISTDGKDASQLKKLLSFDDLSLIPEATALTEGDQMAAGAIGSPYQIVVDFTMSDRGVRLGDIIPSGVKLTKKDAEQSTGIWLIKNGKALRLKDKKHPYRLFGSFTLDYNASLTYGQDISSAQDAGAEPPPMPGLLVSGNPFELEAGTAAVLVYDSRLDGFVTKMNVE